MFKKVLEYAGECRKTTYASMVVMLIGIVMNVLPFLFPVSYTHLDVYKRQPQSPPFHCR